MGSEVICFKQNKEKNFIEFYRALNNDEIEKASRLFWRLKDNVDPEIYLMQAAVFSKANYFDFEINCILKYLTIKDAKLFNPVNVLSKLHFYFNNFCQINTFDFYKDFITKKLNGNVNFDNVNDKMEKEEDSSGLTLVGDESKVKFYNGMDLFMQSRFDEATKVLDEIDEKEEFYEKSVTLKLMAYLSTKKYKEAEKFLLKEIKRNPQEVSSYSWLYRILLIDETLSIDECDEILKIEDVLNNYDLVMIKSHVAMVKKDFAQAKKELKKLKSAVVYSEDYLYNLAKCYYYLGDEKNYIKTIKEILTICPFNPIIRFILIMHELGEDVFEECSQEKLSKKLTNKFRNYINKTILSPDFKDNTTIEDIMFLIHLSFLTTDFELVKKVCERAMESGFVDVVLDFLTFVDISYGHRQLIFQAVLETLYKKPFFILLKGLLKEVQIAYPDFLLNLQKLKDNSKAKYLISIYAQTYSMLLFIGSDLKDFKSFMSKPLEYIYNLPYDSKEDDFIRDSEKIVYMFSIMYEKGNEQIEESFKHLSEKEKQETKDFYNEIKTKLE